MQKYKNNAITQEKFMKGLPLETSTMGGERKKTWRQRGENEHTSDGNPQKVENKGGNNEWVRGSENGSWETSDRMSEKRACVCVKGRGGGWGAHRFWLILSTIYGCLGIAWKLVQLEHFLSKNQISFHFPSFLHNW